MKNYKDTHLSFSSIKEFAKSPAHFIAYKEKKREATTAMLFGSLVHTLILEPDEFSNRYAIYDGRRGTKDFKAFTAQNESKEIIKEVEYNTARIMAESVRSAAPDFLLGEGIEFEKQLDGFINGVKFKGFADIMCTEEPLPFIADVKTAKDASPNEWRWDFKRSGYAMQAAIYTRLTGINDFYFLVVDKSQPYNTELFKVGEDTLREGEERLEWLIEQFKRWDGQPQTYSQFYGQNSINEL